MRGTAAKDLALPCPEPELPSVQAVQGHAAAAVTVHECSQHLACTESAIAGLHLTAMCRGAIVVEELSSFMLLTP